MILLHSKEVELSRSLASTAPEGTTIIEGDGGYAVSAYPSVVITVPAAQCEAPVYGPEGELLGVQWTGHDEYEEVIRMPVSWEAVQSFVAFIEARVVDLTPI